MKIDIYNLSKTYDNYSLIINELHLEGPGVVGIMGNNGAGKTTLLKLILDLIEPDNGKIFSNEKLIMLSDHWKDYTGSFLNEDFLISFLTPLEYFSFIGKIYKISTHELNDRLTSFEAFLNFNLNSKKYIREYSIGNRYKLGIVSALITFPGIVILDEPLNYLDPTSQNQLAVILKNFCIQRGSMVIISSHDMAHLSELCSRIMILENGSFVKDIYNDNPELTYKELKTYFEV